MKICAMQPAFIPPASYFRLFAATDLFVVLDSVQFDRRWYTHRQKLMNRSKYKDWFTLPIKHTDRDTTMIKDLQWADNAKEEWEERQKPFPCFDEMEIVNNFECQPTEFVINALLFACFRMKIKAEYKLASEIETPDDLRGQDRIIHICKTLEAKSYINSTGGMKLYDYDIFDKNGIDLQFLPEYRGNMDSIFERFANEDADDIREEIYANL